jgi:hypothetical protein
MTTASAIYTNPQYLARQWDAIKNVMDNGNTPPGVELLSLHTLQEVVNSFHWDDDCQCLMEPIGKIMTKTPKGLLHFYERELTSDHSQMKYPFGTTEKDEEGRFSPLSILRLEDRETDETFPIGRSLDPISSGEGCFMFDTSVKCDFVNPPKIEGNRTIFNVWNQYYSQKMLEGLLLPVGKILVEQEAAYDAEEGQPIGEKLTKLIALAKDSENPKADRLAALSEVTFKNNYEAVFNAFHVLIQARMISVVSIALLCDDKEGAFDWLCSIEGPIFSGPDAAELTSTMAELYATAPYPDLFRPKPEGSASL